MFNRQNSHYKGTEEELQLLDKLDRDRLPSHVAVIMDGNGRWAQKRGLNRNKGHEKGVEAARKIVECAVQLPIRFLTLYTFSTENWRRPLTEVRFLFKILYEKLISEFHLLEEHEVKLFILGDLSPLPVKLRKKIETVMEKSANNRKMQLNLALNYGSRMEIIRAVQRIIESNVPAKTLTIDLFAEFLFTRGIPDPDLVIRTSGELRISNFLLFQSAYSEFFFTETLWPDFSPKDLLQSLIEYQNRIRRFGKI